MTILGNFVSIPKPHKSLPLPNYGVLRKDSTIFRVHNRKFGPMQFNPCKGQKTRFAPIHDADNNCIESLYATSSFESAVYETIFHDVDAKAVIKRVRRCQVEDRAEASHRVLRDIKLVSLRQPDLKKWRITREELILSLPNLFLETAAWAEAIFKQFKEAEGLEWTSNQCDNDTAYLFFGGRVNDCDIEVISMRDGKIDSSFLADVKRIGNRSDIQITI